MVWWRGCLALWCDCVSGGRRSWWAWSRGVGGVGVELVGGFGGPSALALWWGSVDVGLMTGGCLAAVNWC